MKANKILLVFLIFYVGHIQAQEIQDSVKIYFRQGYSVLEPSHRNNREALDRIADSLRTSYADSVYQLKRIQVVGGASPEGSILLNRRLSVKRANVLFDYLSRCMNWQRMRQMTILQKVTICDGYSNCMVGHLIGICIKNIFRSCAPPGYIYGMRKYGILLPPCQCLPSSFLYPNQNRQNLSPLSHTYLRSHVSCILL